MLSKPAKRDLKHNRTIKGKGYKREDGLWDIEVFLIDSKTYSFENMHRGYISSGEPLHDMAVRLTLNDERKIIDIEAVGATAVLFEKRSIIPYSSASGHGPFSFAKSLFT